MSQQKLLITVIQELERLHIPYMVTGSIAASLQGEPRSTHDIDFVIAMQPHQAPQMAQAFQMPDYYLDEYAIAEAIKTGPMFNLLECTNGDKVDFWLLTQDEFDQSRFARRRLQDLYKKSIYFSTPEDTILMKLKWAQQSGGSEKQFTDCLRIFEVQHSNLDLTYMNTWASKLGISDLLKRIKTEATL